MHEVIPKKKKKLSCEVHLISQIQMGRLMLFYELNKQFHDWLNLKQILNNSEFIPRQEQKLT